MNNYLPQVGGVDRSNIREKITPKEKSYGNSQVLPKNYKDADQIETVIKELTEQVAARLRAHHVACGVISLAVGNSYKERKKGNSGFNYSMKIIPTNLNSELKECAISMFRNKWQGDEIRFLSISCGKLSDDSVVQLDLFDTENKKLKQRELDYATDKVRKQYGFTSLVKLSSKKRWCYSN